MQIIGYGEDALTLWALKNCSQHIFTQLGHESVAPPRCLTFYRPSFGRGGGEGRAEFGEFDFVMLTEKCIYLGESKWNGSSEVKGERIILRPEQTLRHEILPIYIEEWLKVDQSKRTWSIFSDEEVKQRFADYSKIPAPAGSLLAKNIQIILNRVSNIYKSMPEVVNVLLYMHDGSQGVVPSVVEPASFKLVTLNYSRDTLVGGYMDLS